MEKFIYFLVDNGYAVKIIEGEDWEKLAVQQDLDEPTQSGLIKEIHAVRVFFCKILIVHFCFDLLSEIGRQQKSEREGNEEVRTQD
jgi:hypothetical protein